MRIPREFGPRSGTPSTLMLPRSGGSKPAMMLSSVDLPQPEGPTMATNSPSPTLKSMPSSTSSEPRPESKLLLTECTVTLAGIAPPDELQRFEQAHHPVEHQTDYTDDDHAADHQVVAIAGVARIDDQVAQTRVQRDHLGGHYHE